MKEHTLGDLRVDDVAEIVGLGEGVAERRNIGALDVLDCIANSSGRGSSKPEGKEGGDNVEELHRDGVFNWKAKT